MTTLSKTQGRFDTNSQTISLATRYDRFIAKLEFSYFALIAMVILIGSCYGGITTMQIFKNNAAIWEFVLAVSFTMASLVACLGQSPTKWVVNLFAASLFVNTILLLANIL